MKNQKGFTLIELMVSIAIIAILSAIVMFSVTQYINKGKDSNVSGNLAVLIPAGEAYYDIENSANGDGYALFCDSGSVKNAFSQMSVPVIVDERDCQDQTSHQGLCCDVEPDHGTAWVACAQEFTVSTKAYCVDSRGVKTEICNSHCTSSMANYQCPDDTSILSSCP